MVVNRNLWGKLLLVEVFAIVFVVGFFPVSWHAVTYSLLFTLLFITCALNLEQYKKVMLWLASSVLIVEWVATALELPLITAISRGLNFVFFATIVVFLIKQIAEAKVVSSRVIFEAINSYLLLGILYAVTLALTSQIDPGAFTFGGIGGTGDIDFIYYGFVTLTTLGYGDLLPLKPYSKSLSILISVSGQLYLAVILALLVSKYSNDMRRGSDKNS
jgi:hypothetical protein